MHPELLRIPYINIPIYTYGVLLSVGFILGLWLAVRSAEKDGIARAPVFNLGVAVIIASLIGAKLLMIVTEWTLYQGHRQDLFSFDLLRSGGVYYGGFLGGVAAALFFVRRYQLPWWKTADAFAPALALGQAIGRLGCFSAGCCWGKPTTAWWGVRFPEAAYLFVGTPIGVPLHPTQLYEAAATFVLFLLLMKMQKHRSFPGQLILTYALLYGIARFMIEFWRADWRGSVGPLSTSQFIALVLIVGSLILYFRLSSQPREGQ